jgi:hypothetical protein
MLNNFIFCTKLILLSFYKEKTVFLFFKIKLYFEVQLQKIHLLFVLYTWYSHTLC